ncbi:hypothetical protein HY612_02450 [Candidatus Roizmanbacteria bacterium]|nr:hypothetical protein [Candidatus Roizmanbacteria bacterium]
MEKKKILPFILVGLIVLQLILIIFLLSNTYSKKAERTKIIPTQVTPIKPKENIIKSADRTFLKPQLRKKSARSFILSLFVTADRPIRFDATDISLSIPAQVFDVTDVINGGSLGLCPRKNINKDGVEISCIADVEEGKTYGLLDKPIVEIDLYLKKPYEQGVIKIDDEETQVYFEGIRLDKIQSENEVVVSL